MRSAANCALGRRAQSPARVLRSAAASDNCTTVNVALPLRASLTRRSQEQSAIAQLPKSLRGRERSRAVHKTPIPVTDTDTDTDTVRDKHHIDIDSLHIC